MDNISNLPNEYIKNLYRAIFAFLIILSLFFVVKVLSEFRSYSMMGSGELNTITLTGHGEVQAVPDIANIYFTIRKEGKTVKEAQDAVVVVETKVLDFLKESKIDEKDIKTTNASFNPKYEYRRSICPQPVMAPDTTTAMPYYCNDGKQVITGYEAYESITVKLRTPDDVGAVMQGLSTIGVTELSGPNFAIDNEDELQAEARKQAIEDARKKAEALSDDLGVRLGRVASFSESGYYPMPMYYGKDMMAGNAVAESAPAQLPKGENTISSDVTITYEIR